MLSVGPDHGKVSGQRECHVKVPLPFPFPIAVHEEEEDEEEEEEVTRVRYHIQ